MAAAPKPKTSLAAVLLMMAMDGAQQKLFKLPTCGLWVGDIPVGLADRASNVVPADFSPDVPRQHEVMVDRPVGGAGEMHWRILGQLGEWSCRRIRCEERGCQFNALEN